MATEIKLRPEQVGELDGEGAIVKRPTQDVTGAEIDRLSGTLKYLTEGGKRYFVCLPPGKDHPDNTYKLPVSAPVKADK